MQLAQQTRQADGGRAFHRAQGQHTTRDVFVHGAARLVGQGQQAPGIIEQYLAVYRQLRFAVVGSPAYLEGRARPVAPADLFSHQCIRSRLPGGAIYRWEFEKRGEQLAIDVDGPLTLDSHNLMRDAALKGIGLAYMSEWLVEADIREGRLIRVLGDWTPSFPGLSLYYPGHRHVPAGLRAFIDIVRESYPQAGLAN
jgi:DNA-binding transcriptional LysR family regulator